MTQNPLGLVLPHIEYRAITDIDAVVGQILAIDLTTPDAVDQHILSHVGDVPGTITDTDGLLYVVALEDALADSELRVCAASGNVPALIGTASISPGDLLCVGATGQLRSAVTGTLAGETQKIIGIALTAEIAAGVHTVAFSGINPFGISAVETP